MSPPEIKAKMLGFTQQFAQENNIFQRFVFVYEYVEYLNEHPHLKVILQRIFAESTPLTREIEESIRQDDDLELKGHSLFAHEFWIYYTKLQVIHGKMKQIQAEQSTEKSELDKLSRHFSKPYSEHLLELSFKVVNSEVFDRLDKLHFLKAGSHIGKTCFDEAKSLLYIKGLSVRINIQDRITNAHKMLRHFFITNKDNLKDDFYYAEIAEDEFGELDYKHREHAWRTYYYACEDVNRKVEERTKGEIKDFLIYNSGAKGKVKINSKYL